MSRSTPSGFRLLRMPLQRQQDVVLCRQRARVIAEALGVEGLEQVRVATAVSEIARNAVEYAGGGTAEFELELSPPKIRITIRDQGQGIPQLEEILAGRYVSPTGLGRGIIGARLLMDGMEIDATPKGTVVELEKGVRGRRALDRADVQKVADLLAKTVVADPMEEMALQNRDLAQALEEVQRQRRALELRTIELEQLSDELSETNRGVLALYDELDSLHRLGRVIAGQLDLDSLIHAITEATTELGGAELGAFFQRTQDTFVCHTAIGPLSDLAESFNHAGFAGFFGAEEPPEGVLRIDDLATGGAENLIAKGLSLLSYLAVPVFDSAGGVRAIMIFGHRGRERFSERNERILGAVAAQAAVGMENARLYTSAQAANAAKDHFLAMLSHELRTPLNPVFILLSELRGDAALPASVREDLTTIQRNLDLEARLIDDLLDMTRIVRGKISLRTEIADIHELLQRTAETCLAAGAMKKVQVEFELGAAHRFVSGDKTRLQQVFWNLLNNSIKFTPEGGRVVIRSRNSESADAIAIEFTDTGRGIPPAMISRIFRPFEQGDLGEAARLGGLGLGLTIAQAIVHAHQGEIEARSEGSGQGSTFTIRLRAAPPEAPAPVAVPASKGDAPPPKIDAPPSARWRILLVDDHVDTLETLGRILVRRGHTVFTARDASTAVAIAAAEPLHFLVSDIGLPDRSGLELIREIRAIQNVQGIALSGFGAAADIDQSQAAGYFGHLIKPIDVSELLTLLTQAASQVAC
jgi:signal transduction histidine kinase